MRQVIFLSLVLTSSIAAGYEFKHRVRPRLEKFFVKGDSFITEGSHVSATASNATYEDIVMELYQQESGCEFSAGPYGGSGGGSFNELPDNCRATVSQVFVRSGSRIDAIQLTYRYADGTSHTGGYHGGGGGSPHSESVDLIRGERIVGIFGRSGSAVDRLGFVTNMGRIFGPYGGTGGSNFKVQSCYLRGIFGRSGSRLDSIGFQCSHV